MARCLVLHGEDNVAVALEPLSRGKEVRLSDGSILEAADDVPFAHKIAIRAIAAGEKIRKYGEVIGEAKTPIGPGQHVHVHNIRSLRG